MILGGVSDARGCGILPPCVFKAFRFAMDPRAGSKSCQKQCLTQNVGANSTIPSASLPCAHSWCWAFVTVKHLTQSALRKYRRRDVSTLQQLYRKTDGIPSCHAGSAIIYGRPLFENQSKHECSLSARMFSIFTASLSPGFKPGNP